MFGRGRKKKKERQSSEVPDAFTRKLREEHGSPIISFPRRVIRELGIKFGSEVRIKKIGKNPFRWELEFVPPNKSREHISEGEKDE